MASPEYFLAIGTYLLVGVIVYWLNLYPKKIGKEYSIILFIFGIISLLIYFLFK